MSPQGNSQIAERAPRFRISMPGRIDRLVNAGITTSDDAVARSQRFTNIASYALGLDALGHFLSNSLHDFSALLPVNVYNIAVAAIFFSLHRLHRHGERLVANLLVILALLGHSYVVFAFGLASNLHIYFTLSGVILFFVGVAHWRNFLVLYGLAFIVLVTTMALAGEQGFVAPQDDAFRESLAWQALISAFVLNAIIVSYVLSALFHTERSLQTEYERAETLLSSILPASIAARLKSGRESRIADRLEDVTVLFVDLVGFTEVSGKASPEQVVDYLHRLFSRFDALCERHGVDKIKTIGDSYMVLGGLEGDKKEGALSMGYLALDMLEDVSREKLIGRTLGVRAGMHLGPVVAGVIGDRRFAFDAWGDTVNTAARLESGGVPGHVQVSETYREFVGERFEFQSRGPVELKGLGKVETCFLTGVRPPGNASGAKAKRGAGESG